MKIYVASSWRNAHQPKVVQVLRSAGHEVYDFKNPKPGNVGFSWRQVDAEHAHGEPVTAERWRRMVDHPIALDGYALDMGAMKWADACVYVLPCGRSASFEAGWFQGQGKPLVVLAFEPMEPELMFREAAIVGSLSGMLDAVTEAAAPIPSEPPAGSTATRPCGCTPLDRALELGATEEMMAGLHCRIHQSPALARAGSTQGVPGARRKRFNDSTGALTWNRRSATEHPDRCICQDETTPHRHYDYPPHACARCVDCNEYRPAVAGVPEGKPAGEP